MKFFGHIDDIINKLAVDARVAGRKIAVDIRGVGHAIDNLIGKQQDASVHRRAEHDIMGCPIDK